MLLTVPLGGSAQSISLRQRATISQSVGLFGALVKRRQVWYPGADSAATIA